MTSRLGHLLPAPALSGPRVRLVRRLPEHNARLRELHLTPEVGRWWGDPDEEWPEQGEKRESIDYTVMLDDVIVGYIEWWAELDPYYKHAGIDLFLDPSLHGQGLGTEMLRVVCAHLIDERDFHRLVIDPRVDNEAAIASYRKVGFKPVGVTRRSSLDRDRSWKDDLLMDLLAEELVR